MRVLKIHQLQIAVAVLFLVLAVCFFKGGRPGYADTGVEAYNQDWQCSYEDRQQTYGQLPLNIKGIEETMLSRRLEDEADIAVCVGFYTIHQTVEAYVDGELVYSLEVPRYVKSRTPGKCWNFIPMKESYRGKILEIHIRNCYEKGKISMPDFRYGARTAIIMGEMRSKLPALIISVIMFIMGILMWTAWCVMGKRMNLHRGLPWLALFSFHLGIWSGIETHVLQLMFGREILFGQIASMSLKLIVCPVIRFVQVVYQIEEDKLLNLLCGASILDFTVSFILQFFGWVDYEGTLWVTHIIVIVTALSALLVAFGKLKRYGAVGTMRKKRVFLINAVCVCVLVAGTVADGLNYYYGFHYDMAAFSRMGWLIYIVILAVQILSGSARLIKAGKQMEEIREKTELDGLTRLKNRMCFEQDIAEIPSGEYKEYAMVMFDLNDMKKMNDLYGHGMGDCYLIIGSEIIRDIFESYGEIYRIGGDEFCLVSNRLGKEEYQECEAKMCSWMESLKGTQVKEFMKIASGYAKYNRNSDMNLQDVLERADKYMYQRKREQKK